MKKALPYLGAALSALAISWSAPVQAQDTFKDVPQDHWAYQAVAELQQKGILLGYPPEGLFKGRRYMTRYEFAVALQRALSKIVGKEGPAGKDGAPGAPGATGATGADGAQGPQGVPGVTPEELAQIRRLANEFKNELAGIGANIGQINSRLDALAKQVADLKSQWDRAIKVGVGANFAIRGDYSRFPFVDKGGAGNFGLKGFSSVDVIHDIHLLLSAKTKDANFTGDLAFTNYLSYRGNTLTQGSFALNPLLGAGAVAETIMPLQAQVDIPVTGIGENTTLTVGRYKQHGTALTYRRPDLDPYFNIQQYDDGNYIQDGIKLNTKFGSVKTSLFVGSFATVADSRGNAINAPIIGAGAIGPGGAGLGGFKPVGINALGAGNVASQVAGVNLGIPFFNFADLGVTADIFNTGLNVAAEPANNPFNSVTVYGANLNFKPIGRLHINAEVAKSVTGSGTSGDGQSNDDNNAYALHVGYGTGPVSIHAGYNDIDPRFGAPGSWLTLGNWYNPTNVRGPYLSLGYKASDNLSLHVGGNYLEGARNRPGYLNMNDRINQVKAGLEYKISSRLTTSVDYEGVMYALDAPGSNNPSIPIEQYLTLGAGLQLNNSAKLKFGYQMINWQNVGGAFGGSASGINGLGAGGGNSSNATVFTTSINLKF